MSSNWFNRICSCTLLVAKRQWQSQFHNISYNVPVASNCFQKNLLQKGGSLIGNLLIHKASPVLTTLSSVPVRHNTRGREFNPNNYKRIKKHGWKTRMRTNNGKITVIRRMIKGISKRRLTH